VIRSALVVLVAAAALVAGCGDDSSTASTGSDDAAMKAKEAAAMKAKEAEAMKAEQAAMKAKGAKVKLVSSQFGRVLADGRGQAVYLFAREKSAKSECYGACAKAWPPLLTKAKPTASKGARRSLIGTTRRRDGKLQVTYGGHPVYYYKDDSPGKILCQNVTEFGGAWLVVRANGTPVT